MGNFYTNLVIPTADAGGIVATLEKRGRRAYVATSGPATFVYDEACDGQDLDELRRLAEQVSRGSRLPVLAVCNHDDDVLWLALAEQGRAVDVYDSAPGYFDGDASPPRIANVDRLCAAFGAVNARADVERLLAGAKSTFTFEVDRHRALLQALGADSDVAFLGYRYVSRGELAELDSSAELFAVANAPAPGTSRPSVPIPKAPPPAGLAAAINPIGSPELAARMQRAAAVLALSEFDVPAEFEPILGRERLNGLVAFARFQRYVMKNSVLDPRAPGGPTFRFNPVLSKLLGTDHSSIADLMLLFTEKLALWESLDEKDRADIEANDPGMNARIARALEKGLGKL